MKRLFPTLRPGSLGTRLATTGGTLLAVALLVQIEACASKVPERFHTLLAAPAGTVQAPAGAAGQQPYVDVQPVAIPAQVDHLQMVVRHPDDSLSLLEQDRWAAPLQDELRSAIVARLATRWGALDVRAVSPPKGAVWRVKVDVQRFESVPGRLAWIEAAWSVTPPAPGASSLVCRSSLRETPIDAGMAALAAAHRRALDRLVDQMAGALSASGTADACPTAPPA